MLSINYNPSVLKAQNNLAFASDAVSSALERMSTGYKINRASDDAAGLYVSTKMSSQIRGLLQAKKNVSDGLSLLNTAEGDLGSVQDLLLRIRDLSLQASNGIYDDSARKAMQDEADLLIEEVYRIIDSSNFNGMKIFDGGGAAASTFSNFSAFGSYSWKLNAGSASVADVSAVSAPPRSSESVGISGSSGVSTLSSVSRMTEEEAIAQGYTLIKTAQDLDNIRNDLDGKYILMNDIDLSSYSNWDPIGKISADGSVATGFTGILDGNGYSIKNMNINDPVDIEPDSFTSDAAIFKVCNNGLFSVTNGAEIKNVNIENAEIYSLFCTGGLVGTSIDSRITNCSVTGNIVSQSVVGGLIGATTGCTVSECYSDCDITTKLIGYTGLPVVAGGLIGAVNADTLNIGGGSSKDKIVNCYALGSIIGIGEPYGAYMGGLTALNEGVISDCYAMVSISQTTEPPTTGAGFNDLPPGAIVQANLGEIKDCIYNTDISSGIKDIYDNQGTAVNLKGLTTAEMQDPANWAGWDTDIWDFSTYPPKLKWETQSTNPDVPSAVGAIRLQVGANASAEANAIIFNTSFELGDIDVDFSSSQTASNSLDSIDALLDRISKKRSEFGAIMNRLESVLNTQTSQIENLTASKSTIMDADIAQESADYVKNQILQQTTASLLAQAQSANNAVIMALIRG